MSIYSDGSTDVIDFGIEYLKTIGSSYFLTAITMSISVTLKSIGNPMIPMIASFAALFANALFNYIFIFVLNLSVYGAALSTVIARLLELIIIVIYILKLKIPIISSLNGYLNFDLSFIKDYLKVAMPVIINVFFWALGTTIYTIIYGITGKNGQGAVQVAMTVQNFFIVFGMSIGNACTFLLANLLGAAKYPKAKSYAKKCLILAGAISIIFGALVMLTADYLIIPFKLEQDVANSALSILKIVAVMIFFKTINFTAIVGVLRSGGDTFFCFLIDLISVWGVGIPLALYGAYVLKTTILWLYILVSCEEFLKSILCLLRVRTGKWLKRVV
jgi:putative MATE family efflux protein